MLVLSSIGKRWRLTGSSKRDVRRGSRTGVKSAQGHSNAELHCSAGSNAPVPASKPSFQCAAQLKTLSMITCARTERSL